MAANPNYDKVSLLLRPTGANGSTVFADDSPRPKTATAYGDVQISTAQSTANGASILFDGSGDYLQYANSAEFDFGAGDFSVQVKVRPTSLSGYGNIVSLQNGSAANSNYAFVLMRNGAGWYFKVINGSTDYGPGSVGTAAQDAWTDIEMTRYGNSLLCFVNGALVNTTSLTGLVLNNPAGAVLCVGQQADDYYPLAAYIGALCITKGVAVHTAAHTPDSFFLGPGQLSGNVKDATGTNAARLVRAYREDTGALTGQSISDAGTGNYVIEAKAVTAHTLVFYPAVGETTLPALVLRGVTPE